MTQNTHETIHREAQETEAERESALPLEIVNAETVPAFTDACAKLREAIAHDETVTMRELLTLEQAIQSWRFDVGKEEAVSIGEFDQTLKEQVTLWKIIEQEITHGVVKDMSKYTKLVSQLTCLPQRVAKKLSIANRYLSLNNLASLSDEAAEVLGDHDSALHLPKVAALSDNSIASFSRHARRLEIGLTDLSKNQAHLLGKKEGELQLPKLKQISDEALTEIVSGNGSLMFNLDTLSVTGARILAGYQGTMLNIGINQWTDEVIEALSMYQGTLQLQGLQCLSERSAAALSMHQGRLSLPNLNDVSEHAVRLLAKYEGTIEMIPPEIRTKISVLRKTNRHFTHYA